MWYKLIKTHVIIYLIYVFETKGAAAHGGGEGKQEIKLHKARSDKEDIMIKVVPFT